MFSCEFCKIFKSTLFHRTPPVAASEKLKAEAGVRRCSVKKMFLEILLNSQENTCARVSFLQPWECKFIKIESLTRACFCEFCKHLFDKMHTVVAPGRNFTNIRLAMGVFFVVVVNSLKLCGTYFDALLEFSKSLQKYLC